MPRANTKECYKSFTLTCEARGSTEGLAREFLSMEIKHKKLWVKGNCEEGEVYISDALGGGYQATCTLTFTDNRYK